MDLFKLLGKIVVDNKEAIANLQETSEQAKDTGKAFSDSGKDTENSNKKQETSFSKLKSKVNEYKSQGMTTSQAWRKANTEMKDSTETASGGMVDSFKKIGLAIGTFLSVNAIKDFGTACIEAAAEMNATNSQFSQVFGDLEQKASKSLSGIADSAGISENRMKGSYTKIAAFAKTTGMETEDALGLADRAMVAVADSAAFYDRSLEETTESLQSFLKGNYENDAALGLSCTEVTRNAAANELYGESFNDLSESQKQLTLLQMVEDANKTSGALGQAARESDTWTNMTGNLQQAWKDFQAVLGSNILPGAVDVVKTMVGWVESWTAALPGLVNWCKEHETIMTVIGIALGTVVAAITAYNIAINAATIATTIATAASTAFGAVMAFITSPVTLVVLAIGALIAAGVALYQNWDVVSAKCTEIFTVVKDFLVGVWDSIREKTIEVWNGIKDFFAGIWDSISNTVSSVWNGITSFFSTVWETIKNIITVGLMLIVEIVQTYFELITLPFRFIWENCKEYVFAAWEWIKEKVSAALGAVSTKISNIWNSIKETTSAVWNAVKNAVSAVWNTISQKVSAVWNAISEKISAVWNTIKSAVTAAVDAVKSKVSAVFNSIKSTVSDIMSGVKSAVSTAWNAVKTSVSNAVTNVKNKISDGFTSAKTTISNILENIKDKFTSIFDGVKKTVSGAIDKIKGYFNFSWSLPKIKLPHFSIEGEFSLDPPSIPHFSIDWYAKAMNSAMILNRPTIFGYSAESGKYLGGGEAGSEVVAGASTLMNMISAAVAAQNDGVVYYLQKLIEILASYFPQVLDMMKQPIPAVVEANSAAAALAVPMNHELGKLASRKAKGR